MPSRDAVSVDLPAENAAPLARRGRRGGSDSRGKPVNLRDVAREANVSVATVSMVLNDNPRISRATHLRISRIIEKLGYQPNRLAQSLSSRYTRVLAVMLPALRHAFADAYFGELISGICDRAGKLGYKVLLEQAKPEFVKDKKHVQIFERRYIDGMLVLGMNDRCHFLEDFKDNRYPLCVVDNYFRQWSLDHAVCDVLDVYQNRLQAVAPFMDESWSEDGRFTEDGGAAATAVLLRRHPDLTAIFCGNDKMAIGALHYLAGEGIRVPQDVSVVGFDDLPHAAFISPTLTTVHLPLYNVGALAVERLIDRIHGRAEKVTETLPTHLVVRNSTGMVRVNDER
jgi:LacI family transcriptional regulator